MNPSAGLVTALNKMREMSVDSGDIFHQYFPVVDANTNIGEWGAPIFGSNYQAVQESFFGLLKQIAYVATVTLSVGPVKKLTSIQFKVVASMSTTSLVFFRNMKLMLRFNTSLLTWMFNIL